MNKFFPTVFFFFFLFRSLSAGKYDSTMIKKTQERAYEFSNSTECVSNVLRESGKCLKVLSTQRRSVFNVRILIGFFHFGIFFFNDSKQKKPARWSKTHTLPSSAVNSFTLNHVRVAFDAVQKIVEGFF